MEVQHLGFIVAAYGVAGLVLGVTVLVLLIDYAAQKRQLARFGDSERNRP